MNKKISLLLGVVVLMGISFYVGGKYYSNKNKTVATQNTNGMMRGLNTGNKTRGGTFGGLIAGDIISRDAQSITVSLRDGGSKIIFYTDKTNITKTITGGVVDLSVGEQVNVTGITNPDGSVIAQSVQIRPVTPKTFQ